MMTSNGTEGCPGDQGVAWAMNLRLLRETRRPSASAAAARSSSEEWGAVGFTYMVIVASNPNRLIPIGGGARGLESHKGLWDASDRKAAAGSDKMGWLSVRFRVFEWCSCG